MSFLNALKNGLAGIGRTFLTLLVPSVKAGLSEVVTIATASVVQQATKTISGEEKFSNAVQNVLETVKASGKIVAQKTAETAVQAAYEAVIKGVSR